MDRQDTAIWCGSDEKGVEVPGCCVQEETWTAVSVSSALPFSACFSAASAQVSLHFGIFEREGG